MKEKDMEIGTTFVQNGALLKVVENVEGSCRDCYFFAHEGCTKAPNCIMLTRDDKKDVIFERIN